MKYKKPGYRSTQVSITNSPIHLQEVFAQVFTKSALDFVAELVIRFEDGIEQLHWNRLKTTSELHLGATSLNFNNTCREDWKIGELPSRLHNRRVDLGDVSPANTSHFIKALNAPVQGVQVDFDDGHCPTWHNQIVGLHNVYQAVHGGLYNVPKIENLPILMLRPRAWNMIEHNIMINGKKAPGPLVDFGLLMYHNAQILYEHNCGPYFYLSKVESAKEAKLWNDIFLWTQRRLNLPHGTIKACVLIENILSAFAMDEILYQLKDHSLGLNCGIWDYAASIICKLGHNRKFLLPDRNKYVNVDKHFLKQYVLLVIKTCHARGAPATCGMSALLNQSPDIVEQVKVAKKKEILMGADGFLVYDETLVPSLSELWNECSQKPNQIDKQIDVNITASDLLEVPVGDVTLTVSNTTSKLQFSTDFVHNKNSVMEQAAEIFVEIVTMRYAPEYITTYLNDHIIFKQRQAALNAKL
ncbi:hypothetical protein PPYR_10581 [Photinus pyralis]|uniref:malate synthase n=1 Tax=Photinus pyralis TaxID=7054 RepID=A0A5N4AGM8_PHOPY|nr:hypothetical protein PPYR_10581 [Photinus pyralis]